MSSPLTRPPQLDAAPNMGAINSSLRRLESALASGDVQQLRVATDLLREALDPLRARIGPLQAAQQDSLNADPRQLRELRRQLASCTDLMGRSIRANLRAMRVLAGRADSAVYCADGTTKSRPACAVDVTT